MGEYTCLHELTYNLTTPTTVLYKLVMVEFLFQK